MTTQNDEPEVMSATQMTRRIEFLNIRIARDQAEAKALTELVIKKLNPTHN